MVQIIKKFDASKKQIKAYDKHHSILMDLEKEIDKCDFETVNNIIEIFQSIITYENIDLLPEGSYIDLANMSTNMIKEFGRKCSCKKK